MRRGDIWMVSLEPTVGDKQRGRRPVLIVSPDDYNKSLLPLICPITPGGHYVRSKGLAVTPIGSKTTGVVLCNQMRTLDLKARKAKRIEAVDARVLQEVLWTLHNICAD